MPQISSEVPLESFLELSPDAFIGFERSGRIVLVNRPAEELLGHDRAELIGQSIEVVLPTLSPGATPTQGQVELRRRDGTTLTVELSPTPIEAGKLTLILCRLGSITAASGGERGPTPPERNAPRAPEQIALLKDEFLATLAHELRTPLHSMLGWTQLMRSGPRDKLMTARALEVIERSIRRQAQVIDDLIDLAEIMSGQLRLDVRAVRVTPIIDATLERVSDTARSKSIRLIRSVEAEEAEILADPDRLERVLWKLMSNALKFTSEGGHVELRSQVVGSLVQITISDTGQGIDPVILPRIFDSVRQGDESPPGHEWPGLGLSIVRSLVEMQGGSVHADSAGLGQGASLVVSLPLSGSR